MIKNNQNWFLQDKKMFRLLLIALLILLIMAWATNGKFLSTQNFSAMLFLTPELGILSLGIMLAMIVGGIDLSIVSIANLSAIIGTKVMLALGSGPSAIFAGCLAGLATGLCCGFFNGLLVARIKVHPILVTLGTFQLFQGIAIVLTKGYAVTNLPEVLSMFGNGAFLGIPYPFILLLLLWQALDFTLNRTGFGQSLYLIGTNYKASVYSGLESDKNLQTVYMWVGCIAAIAGLVMAARTNAAKADYGTSYTLQTILICMLGGVSWNGGVGKPSGIILSVFILQFLASGFGLLRYSNFFRDFTSGAFLIFILLFYYYMEIYDTRQSKKMLTK